MRFRELAGSGERIMLMVVPLLTIGTLLNIVAPSFFQVGGPPMPLKSISMIILIPGVGIWMWSVVLILSKVPKGELITNGPYAVVKHPLYTSVAFLVLPWSGFLLNTWLGVFIGAALYIGSRIFSPKEERDLSETFGKAWDDYCDEVMIPWL